MEESWSLFRPYRWLAERSVERNRRKLIHRESFRASVLQISEIQAVLQSIAEKKCLLTTPLSLSMAMRQRKGKRYRAEARIPMALPGRRNQMWTMDFTRDSLASGRNFRTLNLTDGYTRVALCIEVDSSLPGLPVVQVLERGAHERGVPEAIQVDNGPEFISRVVDQWAYANGVTLHFFDPGKPVQNAFIESFNGKFRDECLNQSWYTSLEEARQEVETWRVDYNTVRPHNSLGYLTPEEYAAKVAARPASPPTPVVTEVPAWVQQDVQESRSANL